MLRTKAACNQSLVAIETDQKLLNPDFLYYVLKGMYQEIRDINGDKQRGGLNMPLIREIRIPLPPLKVQEEIVTELEGYVAQIDNLQKDIDILQKRLDESVNELWH